MLIKERPSALLTTRWPIAVVTLLLSASTACAPPGWTIRRVGFGFTQPVYLAQAPGDDRTLYVVERLDADRDHVGQVIQYDPTTLTKSTFLDLDGPAVQDGGLLTLAFHPDYPQNGLFYLTSLVDHVSRLDEYATVDGVPQHRRVILQYDNPRTQHAIAWIGFKPGAVGAERHVLYVTTGDGGIQADDPAFRNVSQDTTTLLGKVLRLNVDPAADDAYPDDSSKNFAIPPDNPLAGDDTGQLREVLYAGFRHPWRASFDRESGDLYIADIGYVSREEVSVGVNDGEFLTFRDFGAPQREGSLSMPIAGVGAPSAGSIEPILEIDHPETFSAVVGGYVHRGPVPALFGQYLFGRFGDTAMYAAGVYSPAQQEKTAEGRTKYVGAVDHLADITADVNERLGVRGPLGAVSSFAEDSAGNVYVISLDGEIFKFVSAP